MRRLPRLLLVWVTCAVSLAGGERVGPVPDSLRQARKLDAFYQKLIEQN